LVLRVRYRTLKRHELAITSGRELARHFFFHGLARNAFFVRIAKSGDTLELRPAHEVAKLAKLVFRFAGMTDDERRSKHQRRDPASQPLDELAKALASVSTTHAAEHGVGCMLERHVDVRQDTRMMPEKLDEAVGHRLRIKVKEAHPANPGHVGYPA